ncbi:metal ABC transporter permease [Kallotenue papyrolyticum]|uniref:metal ABC transporter permease n=1 Tax=Kallotenue papyrolyticum TaxID=1325125 RepID=UPI000492B690|nr:metal ABC transporter permease [Kallotenue papyrolyticum]
MIDLLLTLFTDYTLRTITLGAAILGLVGGALGTFALLRRQSLLGDALAHAALPGIALAFLLTQTRATPVLLAGAALTGWLANLAMLRIVAETRISEDAATGIVLTVFFGFGIMLLTWIQQRGSAAQAGLDRYLFGQAASLIEEQVMTMGLLGGLALLVVALLFKEFKLITFDPVFAASIGLPVQRLGVLLTSLIVVAVLIGLQTVGVVLMAAMLVAPAAAARQWTERLGVMLALSGLFGALAGVSGALISVSNGHLPTGPLVILSATLIVIVSLLFGAARGLVWQRWRARRRVQSAPATGAAFESQESWR